MVLNIPCATIAVSRALKAEEITGLSNGKYCGFKILVGWKKVELRGSQTYTQAKDIDRLTWKKIELQGSQTVHFNLRLV